MKKTMRKLLLEFLKDSKRSDREISRILGVSQPTVTRTRKRLVKTGMIREFTVMPDFAKMGYEIMAITSFKLKMEKDSEERITKWAKARPDIIFGAKALGNGKNRVLISIHRSYTDFSKFITGLRLDWGHSLKEYSLLLISLEDSIIKPLSPKYIAEREAVEDKI